MNNLQFIQQLYNGKSCYADALSEEQLAILHIESGVEAIVRRMVSENRVVFLTGNPGDGKTFIIRALEGCLQDIYVETDLNSVTEDRLDGVLDEIYTCYESNKPCVIAVNEFPFYKLIACFKNKYPKFYNELICVKKNILIYGHPSVQVKRICIVDLNERNLLDKDKRAVKHILDKLTELLVPYCESNRGLAHNVFALQNDLVQQQLLGIFSYIAMSGEHFVIRDILGTLSYMLISCLESDHEGTGFYYDALFDRRNDLSAFADQLDPILLSEPDLDEKLWNGELLDGWLLDCPQKWPAQITRTQGTIEDAVELFKSIKRKFFFENVFARSLEELQPRDLQECTKVLVKLKQDTRSIKQMLIYSMNKLFLSTDNEREKLRSWTTHSYDLSRPTVASISTKYIDADDLALASPELVSWLSEMEYVPSHIVMYSKTKPEIRLAISIDLLRSLIMIKNGYPPVLLSSRYEQEISQFVQALRSAGIAKGYPDGRMLIANRREGTQKHLRIEDGKYYFGNEVEL